MDVDAVDVVVGVDAAGAVVELDGSVNAIGGHTARSESCLGMPSLQRTVYLPSRTISSMMKRELTTEAIISP